VRNPVHAATVRQSDFERLLQEVAPRLGIVWQKYRRRQSRRGLRSRLTALGLGDDLEAYRRRLLADVGEQERLVAAMRVTVSRFYRDRRVWRGLDQVVLPQLRASLEPGAPLRAWSVGCACGEEPYTLALLWSATPGLCQRARPLEVLATDIDERVLRRAARGMYDQERLDDLPRSLRAPGWSHSQGQARLGCPIRRQVRFARRDLLHDVVPQDQHLILCRYLVFTYYRGERLARAVRILLSALSPGGALVIGERETPPPELASTLEPWPGAPSVYRRRAVREPGCRRPTYSSDGAVETPGEARRRTPNRAHDRMRWGSRSSGVER
jgi:chemotaxis protein methyltransferase CheR